MLTTNIINNINHANNLNEIIDILKENYLYDYVNLSLNHDYNVSFVIKHEGLARTSEMTTNDGEIVNLDDGKIAITNIINGKTIKIPALTPKITIKLTEIELTIVIKSLESEKTNLLKQKTDNTEDNKDYINEIKKIVNKFKTYKIN